MISVLLPAYNCRPWIEEALRSVAEQTLPPGEILVADDASTDGTAELVESLGIPRVRILRSPVNLGISEQLNRLIGEAKGRYLMRMDGDDISHPDRFRIQMDALHKRDVGILGSWARRFGTSDALHVYGETDAILKAGLLVSVPFCHPTVVMDRDRMRVQPKFEKEYNLAEDYRLWVQMRSHAKFGNVEQVLVQWRKHDRNAGTGPETAPLQQNLTTRIRRELMAEYGIEMDPDAFASFNAHALGRDLDIRGLAHYQGALKAIMKVDPERMETTASALRHVLVDQWDLACAFAAWSHPSTPLLWLRGRRRLGASLDPVITLKMTAKALLGRAGKRP